MIVQRLRLRQLCSVCGNPLSEREKRDTERKLFGAKAYNYCPQCFTLIEETPDPEWINTVNTYHARRSTVEAQKTKSAKLTGKVMGRATLITLEAQTLGAEQPVKQYTLLLQLRAAGNEPSGHYTINTWADPGDALMEALKLRQRTGLALVVPDVVLSTLAADHQVGQKTT